MPALDLSEITPGLVARIDTQRLRAVGGSETNAQATQQGDRAVTDTRDFLVVSVDSKSGTCVAVPLFTRSSPGSAPLSPAKREGDVGTWLTEDVHYSRWQHWRIPLHAFVDASAGDPGDVGVRRLYSPRDADTLQDLLNWASRNRCSFRAIGSDT